MADFGASLDALIDQVFKQNLDKDPIDVISSMIAILISRQVGISLSACETIPLEDLKEASCRMIETTFYGLKRDREKAPNRETDQ